MKTRWEILTVDDEEVMCESLAAWLREDGYAVDTASSGREAIEKAAAKDYAIYFIDLKMPGGMDGIETMMEIRRMHADASIIIITAYATVDTAITAMKEGAQEYIVKPCNPEEISLLVERIIKVKNLQRENTILRKKLSRQYRYGDIISKNARMREILDLAREVASLRSTVLIRGESGTGKELIARAIHNSGERAAKPFVAVSCAALAETLLESELFGHEKGSFTGAVSQKKGKFELADCGTIFLDEIGDISPKLQVDLLRVLQEKTLYRLGGAKPIKVDTRMLTASGTDLETLCDRGSFRSDLYFRLNEYTIFIPPLRQRCEDIPYLAKRFMDIANIELSKFIRGFSPAAVEAMLAYRWPGNVRQLRSVVRRAVLLAEEVIDEEHLGLGAKASKVVVKEAPAEHSAPPDPGRSDLSLREIVRGSTVHVERTAIVHALHKTGGNKAKASRLLQVDYKTLHTKVKEYGIRIEEGVHAHD